MRAPLFAATLALALAMPAGAEHCTTYETADPEVDVAGQYYFDDDCVAILLCQVEIIFSFWIYEESNGIPGLQRGDEVQDQTCHRMIQPDRIIF